MSAYLRIVHGKAPVSRFDLVPDRPVIIGRGEGCDLRFEERSLSRMHCSIEREEDGWHLVDSKSTNGTRLGGFKVSDTVLASGELIQIGDVRIEFIDDAQRLAATDSAKAVKHPLAGRHFARFDLLRRIHTGRSGTVYHAREPEKTREVALKILKPELVTEEATMQRFERGIHAAAPLHHPGIVQHFATGKNDGQFWLSMEWVDGPSVRDLLSRQKLLDPALAVRIVQGIAEAAEVAAQNGIVHRNIQPSSILVAKDGAAKLGDFVFARSVNPEGEDAVTKTGEIVGDAEYLAPECFRVSSETDCRADVYSLGVCLFHMLTGQPPFREPNITRLMNRALNDAPLSPRLLNPRISERLDQLILRCLAKDREKRFQNPHQLAHALSEISVPESDPTVAESDVPPAESEPTSAESAPSPIHGDAEIAPPPESNDLLDAEQQADEPVSLPSTTEPVSQSLNPPLILPRPATTPAPSPWGTLIATIIIVVGVGCVLMFGGRAWLNHKREREKQAAGAGEESAEFDAESPNPESTSPTSRGEAGSGNRNASEKGKGQASDRGSAKTGKQSRPRSKQLSAALENPERLVVQPGTPLRNISDALEVAKDGHVIEVVTNDAFRGEIKLPPISVHLAANPEFHPVLRNTVRVSGGGTVRIEGFHFEPYAATKPAIRVDKMPDKLELVGCTFRSAEGVLISLTNAGKSATKPLLTIERSFVAGNIVLGITGLPPDLRLVNSAIVADQACVEWQLSNEAGASESRFGVLLRNNTISARSVFTIHLDDQTKPVEVLPKLSIRIDDNIFAFPSQYSSTLFRWESWQQPDVPLDRIQWSGSNNVFTGLGSWSMASTQALSDPAAAAHVFLKSAEEWKDQWANEVSNTHLLPPEFNYTGTPKSPMDVEPGDFELNAKSKQLELGTNKKPLGADIRFIPVPPPSQ